MSTETNKAIVRRAIEECWNEGKLAVFDELFAPTFIYHDPALPDVGTLEDYKRGFAETRSAFPDTHLTIEDLIAEGELVVVRLTWRGTNTGDFVMPPMHIPATGKQVLVTAIVIIRLAEGKAVEFWGQFDNLGWFQQLGLLPMAEPVGS